MMPEINDRELVRWYYCSILSSDAIDRRRLGGVEKLGDKYIFTPKVNIMNKYLDGVDIDDFFGNKEVIDMGISREGFDVFVEKLRKDIRNYDIRSFLEL